MTHWYLNVWFCAETVFGKEIFQKVTKYYFLAPTWLTDMRFRLECLWPLVEMSKAFRIVSADE